MRVLLSLLCMLTLATSAYAECAWVLWEELTYAESRGPSGQRLTIVGSVVSSKECGSLLTGAVADRARRSRSDKVEANGNQVSVQGSVGNFEYRYLCLPDTIHPWARHGAIVGAESNARQYTIDAAGSCVGNASRAWPSPASLQAGDFIVARAMGRVWR